MSSDRIKSVSELLWNVWGYIQGEWEGELVDVVSLDFGSDGYCCYLEIKTLEDKGKEYLLTDPTGRVHKVKAYSVIYHRDLEDFSRPDQCNNPGELQTKVYLENKEVSISLGGEYSICNGARLRGEAFSVVVKYDIYRVTPCMGDTK